MEWQGRPIGTGWGCLTTEDGTRTDTRIERQTWPTSAWRRSHSDREDRRPQTHYVYRGREGTHTDTHTQHITKRNCSFCGRAWPCLAQPGLALALLRLARPAAASLLAARSACEPRGRQSRRARRRCRLPTPRALAATPRRRFVTATTRSGRSRHRHADMTRRHRV